MLLRLVIRSLRFTLTVMIYSIVTLLLGRGPMARRVLRATKLVRRIGRL